MSTLRDYFKLRIAVRQKIAQAFEAAHSRDADGNQTEAYRLHVIAADTASDLLTVMNQFGPQAVPNTNQFRELFDLIVASHDEAIAEFNGGAK